MMLSAEDNPRPATAVPDRPSAATALVRGALALSSMQPLTWTASLLSTIFVPHYLGAGSLGVYAMAANLAALAGAAAALGVPTYLRRHVATHSRQVALDTGGALVLLVGAALLVAVGLSVLLSLLKLAIPGPVFRIALAGMVIATAQGVLSSALVGQERHVQFAWLGTLAAVGGVGASVIVLAMGGGLTGYVAAGPIVWALVFLVSWRVSGFHLQRVAFDPKLLRQIARGGFPFLGWDAATQVRNQADVVLAGLVLSQQAAGWLAAAYRIISIPAFIPTLIVTPLLPALSRVTRERAIFQQILRRSLAAAIILTIPCSAGILALAPAVPKLLHWPSEFHNSIPLMMILVLQQPLMAVDMTFATALIALNQERRWLRALVFGAIFNPAMNLVLLPVFNARLHNGAIGAAVVEVATELLMCAGALILLPSGLVGRETASLAGRVILAGFGLWLVASILRPWSLPLAAVAGGTTYLLIGAVLRVLTPADLQELRLMAMQSMRRHTESSATREAEAVRP